MERDTSAEMFYYFADISTHTLTWSVTHNIEQITKTWKISTHTLTWSVTPPMNALCNRQNISTHTLTWSVTSSVYYDESYQVDFNSHAHVERDQSEGRILELFLYFNSHAHVERDSAFL